MEILNSILGNIANMDIHFLFGITLILVVFCLFYYSIARKQVNMIHKLEFSIKHFEQMNQQLAFLVHEQRRSNHFLAELAGIEIPYSAMDQMPMPGMNSLSPSHANSNVNYGTAYGTERSSNNSNDSAELGSQTKLYVGNIDYSATEAELAAHFARFGQIEFVNIPVNRYTGRARGFGFVTFSSKEAAERAISLNGSEFKGRQIQVNFAKERDLAL